MKGPKLFFISTLTPIAWGITKISLNIIAASNPICLIGIMVISHASSGVWHLVKKSYFSFNFIKSGRYLPACLIIHTGGLCRSSPLRAFKNKLFLILSIFKKINSLLYYVFNRGFFAIMYFVRKIFCKSRGGLSNTKTF